MYPRSYMALSHTNAPGPANHLVERQPGSRPVGAHKVYVASTPRAPNASSQAVTVLCPFVVGVDAVGRKRLPGSNALLIGLGATGVPGYPHYHIPIISGRLYLKR